MWMDKSGKQCVQNGASQLPQGWLLSYQREHLKFNKLGKRVIINIENEVSRFLSLMSSEKLL